MNEARSRTSLTLFLILCLSAFGLCALPGCSDNSDQLIRETLDGNLNIQDDDLEVISDELNDQGILSEYGVELGDYEGTLLQGYSYNIDSIEINGSAATATITITFRDFISSAHRFQQLLEDDRDNLEELMATCQTESKKKKKVAEAQAAAAELKETVDGYLAESLEDAESSNSTSFTVSLSEEDGKWVIDDDDAFRERWFEAAFGEALKQLEQAADAAQEPEEEDTSSALPAQNDNDDSGDGDAGDE